MCELWTRLLACTKWKTTSTISCPEPHPKYDLGKGSIFINWNGVVYIHARKEVHVLEKRQSPHFKIFRG